jgi:hypothetical protein
MVTKQIIQEKFKNPSLMSQIRKISIDAPEDFSVKLAISFGRDVGED